MVSPPADVTAPRGRACRLWRQSGGPYTRREDGGGAITDGRRGLPAVDRVLAARSVREAVAEGVPAHVLRDAARRELAAERGRLGPDGSGEPADVAELARRAVARARRELAPRQVRVVNATGVILHTNLGRAVLAEEAVSAVLRVARAYTNLEFDLEGGSRGNRSHLVEGLLAELTGAEAALVVNNNAAAVYLCLRALAAGREVVVSRGELIEIGGSFRVPDVMAESGARLVEVGTTNRTRLEDYRAALGPETAMLLKAHRSNFRLVGFTQEVAPHDLADLAREAGVHSVLDLGSGYLDGDRVDEPSVKRSVAQGMDLVTFSGDKMLGGPQAGIAVGRGAAIAAMRRHPMARALRIDKLTLAALEATLGLYRAGPEVAERAVPTLAMLAAPRARLDRAARLLGRRLRAACGDAARVRLRDGQSMVGGGSAPDLPLPTRLVALRPTAIGLAAFARRLRLGDPPVVVRLADDEALIDPRTLLPGDAADLVRAVRAALEA
jgi:L-seryl-tRNA(Ser) seleniumtransferase